MKNYMIGLCLAVSMLTGCRHDDFPGVRALMERRAPWLAEQTELRRTASDGEEAFTLRSEDDRLVIEATTANAAAVGVRWYLKYYCDRSMSHRGDMLAPVERLTLPQTPVRIATKAEYRYALNYCTYNYTMSFYTWEDWERELDWMALNGVNLMLVANGSEAVWHTPRRRSRNSSAGRLTTPGG